MEKLNIRYAPVGSLYIGWIFHDTSRYLGKSTAECRYALRLHLESGFLRIRRVPSVRKMYQISVGHRQKEEKESCMQ